MPAPSQTAQLVAYYVERLAYLYQKPRAQATVAAWGNQVMADSLPLSVQDAYDVKTAVGPQLDVLGKYIGLPRNIGEPDPLPFFGFVDYTGALDNLNGFNGYNGSPNKDAIYYSYGFAGQRNTNLSDASYAFMMALQIILNSSDGTLFSIQNYLNTLLPGIVTVIDNRDMTMTYNITVQAIVSPTVLLAFLPRPMGVGVGIQIFYQRTLMDGTTLRTLVTSGNQRIVLAQS